MPAHRAFSDALAKGLIRRFGKGPMGLAKGIVLLPNNRAVKALHEAFLRQSDGGLLLPRLVAVGDIDLDERLGSLLDPIGTSDPMLPVVDPLQRQLILARLVAGHYARVGQKVEAGEAMRLADALGRTLDQLQVEDIAPSALDDETLAGELSGHWDQSLALFRVLSLQWPMELERIGAMDVADRRNQMLRHIAARWRDAPPADFIVAAGIASTSPAIAELLSTIAKLPQGMVVLSDLDLAMPDEEWDALGVVEPDLTPGTPLPKRIESHPQYHLKLLLDRMGFARGEFERWPDKSERDSTTRRGAMVGHAFAPARFTSKWRDLPSGERSLTGIQAFAVPTSADEAQMIALALRETLETEGRTAALVTPDRNLATRVVAHLKRWGIAADDSAGRALSNTPEGTLPVQLVEAAAARFAPVELLTLLKHPLVAAGEGRIAWLKQVRELDLLLRGPRPGQGLGVIADKIAAALREVTKEAEENPRLERKRDDLAALDSWWANVAAMLQPLEAHGAQAEVPLAATIELLRETASQLAGDAAWSGQAGRSVADIFTRLGQFAPDGPALIEPSSLAPMLEGLMDKVAIRPPYGGHPRIFIWGLIEAQLQRADRMILGGLNEGSWPGIPAPDPWLAPGIRRRLGLPGLETRIGLAAHDFAGALAANDVILTRSMRDGGAPTIASRFWLRLEAMGKGMPKIAADSDYAAFARALDHAAKVTPAERPKPNPSAEQRPKRISVTAVDRLKADPFAFYAQRVLGLSSLDSIDAEPTAAWRGTAVHDILEQWSLHDDHDPAKLVARARDLMASPAAHAVIRAMWQPRLMEAIDWIANEMTACIEAGRIPFLFEKKGEAQISGVTLHGIADRIDRNEDGSLAIVDYKTGQPPTAAMVAAGYAMQLGLLGAIAESGGFTDSKEKANIFEYWSLAKSRTGDFGYSAEPFSKKFEAEVNADNFTQVAARIFTEAANRWLTGGDPFIAKLQPGFANYADYDQLMRLEEWYGRDSSPSNRGGANDNG